MTDAREESRTPMVPDSPSRFVALLDDPVIQQMADTLDQSGRPRSEFTDADTGRPTAQFVDLAARQYRRLCELLDRAPIETLKAGPATVILALAYPAAPAAPAAGGPAGGDVSVSAGPGGGQT